MAEHSVSSLGGSSAINAVSEPALLQLLNDGLPITGAAENLISIDAATIAAFVARRDAPPAVLRFRYAVICGPLILDYAKLAAVEFEHCVLEAEVVLSHAKLAGHLRFEECHMQGALRLDWCTIGGSVTLLGCHVEQSTFAHSAKVEGDLVLEGTIFKADASFDRITVVGRASASPRKGQVTNFHSKLSWQDAQLLGVVNFAGAKMLAGASFERVRIGGVALFRNFVSRVSGEQRTVFGAETCFRGTVFAAGAEFRGAHFRGSVTFDTATFNGPALFYPSDNRTRTEFDCPVNFAFARFEHEFNIRSAAFASTAGFARMFVRGPFQCGPWTTQASNGTEAWVGPRVEFLKATNFFGAHFASEANFFGASFEEAA